VAFAVGQLWFGRVLSARWKTPPLLDNRARFRGRTSWLEVDCYSRRHRFHFDTMDGLLRLKRRGLMFLQESLTIVGLCTLFQHISPFARFVVRQDNAHADCQQNNKNQNENQEPRESSA
jgi:hypothetical protein